MSEDPSKVDEILDELGFEDDTSGTSSESVGDADSNPDEDTEPADRLGRLHEAGAITDEEYELIRRHLEDNESTANEPGVNDTPVSQEFGAPITTSEGKDVDFSIVGVFEEVDTTELVMPEFAENLDEDDLPPQFQGGPGRSIICWQMYNHSNEKYEFSHDNLEQIGSDGIAYNQGENPLQEDRFQPGWRTEEWVDIAPDTRIKYASCIEIPVQLTGVKISGYQIDDHEIKIIDEMRFPKSDLPVKVDL